MSRKQQLMQSQTMLRDVTSVEHLKVNSENISSVLPANKCSIVVKIARNMIGVRNIRQSAKVYKLKTKNNDEDVVIFNLLNYFT
jgi:adenine deaminase